MFRKLFARASGNEKYKPLDTVRRKGFGISGDFCNNDCDYFSSFNCDQAIEQQGVNYEKEGLL